MPDITYTKKEIIACGEEGTSANHPRVFLKLTKKTITSCPYCGKKFQQQK